MRISEKSPFIRVALVAQLVEHLTLNQGVQGSNPCRRTEGSVGTPFFLAENQMDTKLNMLKHNDFRELYNRIIQGIFLPFFIRIIL